MYVAIYLLHTKEVSQGSEGYLSLDKTLTCRFYVEDTVQQQSHFSDRMNRSHSKQQCALPFPS